MQTRSRGTSTHERWTLMKLQLCAATLAMVNAAGVAAPSVTLLNATTSEPRAFGYQVGDVVSRSVTVHAPDGLVLDESSVPQPGVRGKALELRSVARSSSAESGARRHELTLAYQVFLSPLQARTLEMPTFALRFQGQPRDQEIRIEAWPVTVSPLVPVEVSPRRGLGELQPDTLPPLIDTTAGHNRLIVYGGMLLVLLSYLAHVYIGLPWWSRAHRPFTQAWRTLRGTTPANSVLEGREAFQRLHDALNRTAGEVLFEQGIDRFVSAQPRFQPLRDDLVSFFHRSRREFFGHGRQAGAEQAWLVEFCRRCRDAERGGA